MGTWIRRLALAGAAAGAIVVIADLIFIAMFSGSSNNAWYFPYSIFAFPFTIVCLVVLMVARLPRKGGTHDARSDES